jgi:hypothetical protein
MHGSTSVRDIDGIEGIDMNSRERVSKKIRKMRHEGERRDVAVATALNMARKNRITKTGGYKRVKKSRNKSRNKRRGKRYNRGRGGR